jgi:hypothetical protein
VCDLGEHASLLPIDGLTGERRDQDAGKPGQLWPVVIEQRRNAESGSERTHHREEGNSEPVSD